MVRKGSAEFKEAFRGTTKWLIGQVQILLLKPYACRG
jgi:hypothetical protein